MRPSASLNLDVAGGDLVFVGGEGGQDFGLFALRDLEEIEGPSELRCDFTKFCTFPEEQKTHIYALVDRHIEEAVNEVWPAMAHHRATLREYGDRGISLMRDIRSDLEERAQIIQEQLRGTNAHFEKVMQQLQSERDARVADLKGTLAMIDKLMQFETSAMDKVVTLEHPPASQPSLADRMRG